MRRRTVVFRVYQITDTRGDALTPLGMRQVRYLGDQAANNTIVAAYHDGTNRGKQFMEGLLNAAGQVDEVPVFDEPLLSGEDPLIQCHGSVDGARELWLSFYKHDGPFSPTTLKRRHLRVKNCIEDFDACRVYLENLEKLFKKRVADLVLQRPASRKTATFLMVTDPLVAEMMTGYNSDELLLEPGDSIDYIVELNSDNEIDGEGYEMVSRYYINKAPKGMPRSKRLPPKCPIRK